MCYHIRSSHDDSIGWCGETLTTDFYFRDVEAAVLNGLHDKKQVVCIKCTDIIINCLHQGKFIDGGVNSSIIPGRFEKSNHDNDNEKS